MTFIFGNLGTGAKNREPNSDFGALTGLREFFPQFWGIWSFSLK
jgi:hypothetical protein